MVWKIFFIISVLVTFLMLLLGYSSDYTGISGLQYFGSLLYNVAIAFVLGLLYSLGWKQQLFSKKSANVFLTILIISMIFNSIVSAFQVYPIIYAQTQNNVIAMAATAIGVLFIVFIENLFLIPFYVGFYNYKKDFESLILVEKPYWRMFSMYCVTLLAAFFVFALTKYTHFTLYNFIDYYAILSCIYEIVFLIGYAWNVRIFNKLFWQITAIPYILLMLMTPFLKSETFNQDYHIKETLTNNPVSIVLTIILHIVFIYIIYQYAYKKEA